MIFFFSFIILIIFLEIFLRLKKKPDLKYQNIKRIPPVNLSRIYEIYSKTGHSQNSEKSESLGWDLIENSHINVKINVPYFEETSVDYILNNTSARSNLKIFKNETNKNLIGYFGCSITYGYGLNNEETYANKFFEQNKEYDYLNFAVPGYSAYQSLIKLKQKIKNTKFKKVVLGIHRDLERRNTCAVSWTKIINNFWAIPFMINIFNINFEFKPKKRFDFKFFKLRVVNLLTEVFNIFIFSLGSIKKIQKNTMKEILINFKKICDENKIELIVLCLEEYNEIYEFLNRNSFNWNTTNINLNETNEKGEFIWQLMPWDNHPNKDANNIFSEKLNEVIHSKQRPFKPTKIKKIKKDSDQEYIYPLW